MNALYMERTDCSLLGVDYGLMRRRYMDKNWREREKSKIFNPAICNHLEVSFLKCGGSHV